MAKILVKQLAPYQALYRDERSGIAWVEDGSSGLGYSCHPNIHHTGSVRGMKKLGYWAKDAKTVRSHGYIYNISSYSASDKFEREIKAACQCGGKH